MRPPLLAFLSIFLYERDESMMVNAQHGSLGEARATLPEPVPVSTTYAAVDPLAAAQWMVRYLGAELIDENITRSGQSEGDDCGAEVAWVRLQQSGYEFHFVKNPNKIGTTTAEDGQSFTPADYVAYVDRLYGNLSEVNSSTYDVWMDFHVGMSVGNLTTVFQALHQGGQEYFFVGADSGENAYYDLFVEIPGTGAILEFSSLVCNLPEGYAITAWDICQQGSVTSYLEGERAKKIKSIPGGARSADDVSVDPTPERMMTSQDGVGGGVGAFGSCSCDGCDASAICWRKTTFASAHAFFGLFFAIEYLGASWTRMGHPGVNIERCATIAWGTFQNGYELHFVDGSSYQSGPMTLDEFAHDLDATRSTTMANGTYDQFMDNHLTLWVDDLDPFLALYDEQDVPFLLRTWSSSTEGGQQVEGGDTHTDSSSPPLKAIILNFPSNGFVVELLSNKGATGRAAPGWDFCSAQ